MRADGASPQVRCTAAADSILVGQATSVTAATFSPLSIPVAVSFEATGGALTPQGTSALIRATSATPQSIYVTCHAKDQAGLSSSATTKIDVTTAATVPPTNGSPARIATSVALTAQQTDLTDGETLQLSIAVTASAATPTGDISIVDAGNVIGTASIKSTGTATLAIAHLAAGTHSLTARFEGTTTYAPGSSAPVVVTVHTRTQQVASSTVVTAAANPSIIGDVVTLRIAVTSAAQTLPTGSVTLQVDHVPFGVLPLSSAAASVRLTTLAAGSHVVEAQYAGDAQTLASSAAPLSLQVNSPAASSTTTTLSVTPLQALEGNAVTLTASVAAKGAAAAGPVSFMDNEKLLGTVVLAQSGVAVFTLPSVTAGSHLLTATFAGSKGFAASSSSLVELTVAALPIKTTTTLMVPSSIKTGSPITLSSAVHSNSGVPTGVVEFYKGSALLGTGSVSAGAATLLVQSLPAGSYTLSARYTGNTTMAASSSNSSTLTVSDAPSAPSIQCSTSAPSVVQGGTATITASATSAAKLTLTTSFTTDKGRLSVTGSSAMLDTAGIAPGVVIVTCTATDTLSNTTSAVATVQVTSPIVSTTTSLVSSPVELFASRAANLSVMVSAASGSVPGQVTVFDGSTPLGTASLNSGAATVTTSSLAAGNHQLVAKFAGSAGFAASSSAIVNVTVNALPAAPTVACTAMPTSVNAGDLVTLTGSVSSASSRPVTLTMKPSAGQLNTSGTNATMSTAGLQPGWLSFQCEGQDDLGQQSTATSMVWINAAPGEQAKTAFTFIDSVGVNVHLHYNNTPYAENFPGVLASMKALGVRHYRSGIDAYAYDWEYANAEKLAAAGIKADWIIDAHETANDMNAIARNAPNSIEAFEGPNEDDPDVGATLTNFMKLLHTTVRSNPATATVPILAPTMIEISSVAAQPALSAWVDFGNMHDYYTPRHPETASYGGSFFTCGPYGSMDFNICVAAVTAPGKPVISTETGYISGTQSDEVIGKYIARTLFLHLNKGVMRTYLYEFADEVFSPNFGLVHEDLTPKPAYTGLKNLMSLFNDTAFTAPAKVDYSLSNTTPDVQHALFQKRDGTILLVLWRGVASANPVSPYQTYNIAPQQVSIRMGTAVGNATAYTVLLNGDLGQAQTQTTSSVTSVTISDGITVVSFAPVAH